MAEIVKINSKKFDIVHSITKVKLASANTLSKAKKKSKKFDGVTVVLMEVGV